MRGHHDDLIMALAIGVWLYDTSPQLNKHSVDLNSAMLNAFAVNTTKLEDTVMAKQPTTTEEADPGKRKKWPSSNNPYTDFTWLVK